MKYDGRPLTPELIKFCKENTRYNRLNEVIAMLGAMAFFNSQGVIEAKKQLRAYPNIKKIEPILYETERLYRKWKKNTLPKGLTEDEYLILVEMDIEYSYGFDYFTNPVRDRNTVKLVMLELVDRGLVEFSRGLFDLENGETAGSGYGIIYGQYKKVRELLEEYESRGGVNK